MKPGSVSQCLLGQTLGLADGSKSMAEGSGEFLVTSTDSRHDRQGETIP